MFGFLGAGLFWLLAHSGPAFAQVQGSLPSFVKLQPATPGSPQSGHANLSGTIVAGQFQGGGSALSGVNAATLGGQALSAFGLLAGSNTWTGVNNFTNSTSSYAGSGTLLTGLNASSLASGTVPDARLNIGGDLTGPLSTAKLTKLQSKPVTVSFPASGEVLGYDGAAWRNATDSLTLPFDGLTNQSNAFKITTTNGNAILGWSKSGETGIAGSSGTGFTTVSGAGVVGSSTDPGGVGVYGVASEGALYGGVFIGSGHEVRLGAPEGAVWTNGFLWRDYVAGTPSVAVPIAYGSVSGTGVILGGTGNFTVNQTGTGLYEVTINGEVYSNSSYSVTITPVSNSDRHTCVSDTGTPFRVNMFNQAGTLVDNAFQFTVWLAHPNTNG